MLSRFRPKYLSFLLDISSEYVSTTAIKNQSDLSFALKSRFSNPAAFESFQSVDRALFLPSSTYCEPYANTPQSFDIGNATMSTPVHHALVLNTLHTHCGLTQGSRVLDIGCGSGYLCAAMFHTVGDLGFVVGVDRVPQLVSLANMCLRQCPVTSSAKNLHVLDAYKSETDSSWNEEALRLGAPYDVIHVGFSFDAQTDRHHIEFLTRLLTPNHTSRILAGWGNDLCLFDAKGYRQEVAHLPGLARVQLGTYVKPLSQAERKQRAKDDLEAWKIDFERVNGRKPTRMDLFADPKASSWFQTFSTGV